MKRFICLLIIAATLFLFCSCNTSENSQFSKSVNFYYCNESISFNSANGVISSETREAEGYTDSLEQLLSLYIQGPVTPSFVSPFPHNLQVESISEDSHQLNLVLNSTFSELTGIEMTIAYACLVKTIQELTETDSVCISYTNTDIGKRQTITLDSKKFLFFDNTVNADNTEE